MPCPLVDIPFSCRHSCWFCAEPCEHVFAFRASPHAEHASLSVPACKECLTLARQHTLTSIYECRIAVKDALMKRYAKHLAIGLNWTREELEESEFSCKILGGFKRSAWFMYEVARDRINAKGWPLCIDGVPLRDETPNTGFDFDGLHYSSVFAAIEHYAKNFALDKDFLQALTAICGRDRFAFAVRLARLNIAADKRTKKQLIRELELENSH